MRKTLHRKLNAKHLYEYMPSPASDDRALGYQGMTMREIARELTADLMQPRPKAVEFILNRSKAL